MIAYSPVLIALGANRPSQVGTPLETLKQALEIVGDSVAPVIRVARWRRSAAYPPGAGPDFVNGAAELASDRPPKELLAGLHEVERRLGRERRERWGPRVCDLDLIAAGGRVTPDREELARLMALGARAADAPAPEALVLPHPRMHERAFVLAPLADIAPDWRHPLTGATVVEMLAALPAAAKAEVTLLDDGE